MDTADHHNGASTLDTTEQRKIDFLHAYADCGVIRHACAGTAIARSTVYAWIDNDPDFLPRLRNAQRQALDVLETELFRRGVIGTDEPVYQAGKLVGYVRKYSDACLIFALKALAPEKYRERYDVTTAGAPLLKAYTEVDINAVAGVVPATVIEHEPPKRQLKAPRTEGEDIRDIHASETAEPPPPAEAGRARPQRKRGGG